jgi:hypothetical protein
MSRASLIIIAVLLVVIVILGWMVLEKRAVAPIAPHTTVAPTTSATSNEKTKPLSAKVAVTFPQPGASVGKTFVVTGEAPGGWYFEASFPVQVRDKDGIVLASIPAQAQSDWMVDTLVPFKASIIITGSYKGDATLILLKDNPSGLPENDDSVEIPIIVK